MNEIVVAVLGAGRIGRIHAENLVRMPGVKLKTLADPFADLTGWTASEVTEDPAAVLADGEIEAVLICSPTPTHAELIETAAGAGKHVFCEKPIDLDPQRVRRTLEAVDEAGVKLQVGFNRRFDPNFRSLRRAIEEGDLGALHLIRIVSRDPAPPPPEYVVDSGGIFLDMMIHDFDMTRFLAASEVEEVFARGAVRVDPAIGEAGDVDTAVVTLKLTNGALAVIENSRQAVYGYDQRVEVFGARGGMEALNQTPVEVRRRWGDGVRTANPHYFFLERYRRAYVAELEEFFQCIREDREPSVSGHDALLPLLIGLAAKRSLAENRPIRVEAP